MEYEPLPQEGVTVRDDEWGRFPLKYRFNVDSVPVTLEHLPRRSFFPGEDRTSQVMGAPSEDKRFCTMHVCVHGAPAATMPQPKVAVIFRGKGMRAQAESAQYHEDVAVFWQEKAWLNETICCEWHDRVFAPYLAANLPANTKALLLQDHLGCQKSRTYIERLHASNVECVYGPKNMTEVWQPVDAGHIGASIKQIAKDKWAEWLELDTLEPGKKNGDVYGENKMRAKDKRIVTTHILGAAFEQWSSPFYDRMRLMAFVGTGAAMTNSGKTDKLARIEGWPHRLEVPEGMFTDMRYIRSCHSMHPRFLPPLPGEVEAAIDVDAAEPPSGASSSASSPRSPTPSPSSSSGSEAESVTPDEL